MAQVPMFGYAGIIRRVVNQLGMGLRIDFRSAWEDKSNQGTASKQIVVKCFKSSLTRIDNNYCQLNLAMNVI